MNEEHEKTIFGDLAALEKTLSEDSSGERARSMLSYFADVATQSEALLQASVADTERHLVAQLLEGFRASQRIIRHVWETLHGSALAV